MLYAPAIRRPDGEIKLIDDDSWNVLVIVKTVAFAEAFIRGHAGENLKDCDLLIVDYEDHSRVVSVFNPHTAEWDD